MSQSGGRFDFDDGGVYCGAWEDGKAHGQGICTGPKGQGEYAGSWNHGFEVLGVYTWPSGNTYEGNWSTGKRHNLGVEVKGKWEYKGEWTHGFKGKYGVRSNVTSRAKYEGTWVNGLQEGTGTETYDDGGTYEGQWSGGMRHGYGVRQSVTYGMASSMRGPWMTSMNSLRSELSNGNSPVNETLTGLGNSEMLSGIRSGFVLHRRPLTTPQTPGPVKRNFLFRSSSTTFGRTLMGGLKSRTRSNISIASGISNKSCQSAMTTESLASAASGYHSVYDRQGAGSRLERIEDDIDANTTETYYGEWKNDIRTGYGVCMHSDGLTYEGEWLQNQRHGYGCTTYPDGSKEEGKYKHNSLSNTTKRKNFSMKSNKIKIKVAHAVEQAQRAKETALQKSDMAMSRTAHSITKANAADVAAQNAREEAHIARCVARDQDPSFKQPGLEYMKLRGVDFARNTNNHSYLTETETRDVQGPESYMQYSQQNSYEPTTRPDQDKMFDSSTTSILKLPESQVNTIHRQSNQPINSSRVTNSVVGSKQLQYSSPQKASFSSPSLQTPMQKQDLNENWSAQSTSKYLTAKSTSLNNISVTGSNCSITNSSTSKNKKSFFRSLRMKGKKHLNPETEVDGLIPDHNANNQKTKETLKLSHSHQFQENGNTAREKRKAFQKSYSTGERISSSFNKSLDMSSFDYETNQDNYLANYESEMRDQDERKRLNQDVLVPSTYNQNQFAKTFNEPTSFIVAERINVPTDKTLHNANGTSSFDKRNAWLAESQVDREKAADQMQNSSPYGNKSKIDASHSTAGRSEIYSPSKRSENQSHNSNHLPPTTSSSNTRKSTLATKTSFTEETPNNLSSNPTQNEDYGRDFTVPLSRFSNTNYSPLPSKLRKRERSFSETSSDHDSLKEAQTGDMTKLCVIILVFLLIIGFMVIFLQFLT